ncbi:MAG: TetR/AcrR family transcriptional regulator [Acutalibacteraceae bacterium]
MNKSESKYFNTAQRMDEALLKLLQKKDFEYITIKEICTLAGVNRSTFYLHYETIGDLLEESLCYIQEKFKMNFDQAQRSVPNIKACPKEELIWITPELLMPYLNFVKDNRQLYRAAITRPNVFQSDKTYKNMLRHLFEPILERFSVPADEREYMIIFYLKGISAIVEMWIKDDCKEPIEKIVNIILTCIPSTSAEHNGIKLFRG